MYNKGGSVILHKDEMAGWHHTKDVSLSISPEMAAMDREVRHVILHAGPKKLRHD